MKLHLPYPAPSQGMAISFDRSVLGKNGNPAQDWTSALALWNTMKETEKLEERRWLLLRGLMLLG